ncbi:hypothetical protein EMCRGX_G008514 [Ephydatia muelleri]
MVRVRWVCGLRTAAVLATLILLGITRNVAGELQDVRQSSSTQSVAPAAVHQRRRPPPTYSARDMPFDERVKFQKGEVDSFCAQYNYTFPTNKRTREALNRHILVHKEAHVLLCFVPKSGCTTLKVLLYVSQGLLPPSEVAKDKDSVDQLLLEDVMVRASFLSMTPDEHEQALTTYFKFVMYRNPLERMVSVYRSKLSRWPLLGLKRDTPHFNWARRHIYKYTHPEEYKLWEYDRGVVARNVSFEDFVLYLTTDPMEFKYDEHFAPTFDLCNPCRVRYDYYGNFNTFEEDAAVLMKRIHARPSHLRSSYYQKNDTTQVVMGQYFSQLDTDLKRKVLHFFAKELHFYYLLFPEEAGTHKDILGLEDDLPPL